MKNLNLYLAATLMTLCTACQPTRQETWVQNALSVASYQLKATAQEMSGTGKLPRSIYSAYDVNFLESQLQRDDKSYIDSLMPVTPTQLVGQRFTCGITDWTSGFFPGSLWLTYEMTHDEELKQYAIEYTNLLNPIRHLKGTHDIGFMMQCSFGQALRLSPNDSIKAVLIETADNLCERFNTTIGCIRSWDFGEWNYPVIIDNMMNLDLLYLVSRLTNNPKYAEVATHHAKTTMKNHFRPDYTSYHVVSYNDDGSVEMRQTHQGKNDESAWARGQAWGVYGYTLCYRETKDEAFLQQAIHIAEMIMSRVKTNDSIPYWDLDAPVDDSTPRDASAAAVTASALFELSTFVPDGTRYADYATTILKNLSSAAYLAAKGSNQGFILMHSTGSLPHGSEIDQPLNYADYYYLEAMQRYLQLKK